MTVSVYCITSLINGKQYVGITQQRPIRRWQGHVHSALAATTAIARAMRKYGPKNFSFEVVYEAADREEACMMECVLVAALGTRAPRGYNLTAGGDNAATREPGFVVSPEARAKMSAAAIGKPKSAEARAAMSAAAKGKPKPPEHMAKMAAAIRGRKFKRTAAQALDGRIRRREASIRKGAYGVELCNGTGPWRARISIDGRTVHLGLFETEVEAKAAYRDAAQGHLDDMLAERGRLTDNPTAALLIRDAPATVRYDRAKTLRAMWADPAIRAEMIYKISASRRKKAHSQKTEPHQDIEPSHGK